MNSRISAIFTGLLLAIVVISCSAPEPARIESTEAHVEWNETWNATISPGVPEDLSVWVVPETDVGPCNPLCRGRCAKGRCLEVPVDDDFLADAADGALSKTREKLTIPVETDTHGGHVSARPVHGTWQPDTVHAVVLSSRALPGETTVLRFMTDGAEHDFVTPVPLYPAPNAREVPVNLAWMVLSYPCEPQAGDEALLMGSDGSEIPLRPVGRTFRSGQSVLRPYLVMKPLAPGVTYTLWAGGVRTGCGEVAPWLRQEWFTTGTHSWLGTAQTTTAVASRMGRCHFTRVTVTGPAMVEAFDRDSSLTKALLTASPGILVTPLEPSRLITTSMEGHSEVVPVSRAPDMDMPPSRWRVHIVSMLPNPVDDEPACEVVVLRNDGDEPVTLDGWRLTDSLDATGDVLEGVTLEPGQAGAVVTKSFSPERCPAEMELVAGRDLIRVDGSIANAGLSNNGEPLYLFDIIEKISDSYSGWLVPRKHEGEVITSLDSEECDSPLRWSF